MLEVGQVLSLKIRYNNEGLISNRNHPYLVVSKNEEYNTIEIAQLDSLEGKEYKAAFKSNKTILCDKPSERVIDKDSYIQLDNKISIEYYDDLCKFRRQEDRLSEKKLNDTISAYFEYHKENEIDENKIVYIDKNELEQLNT